MMPQRLEGGPDVLTSEPIDADEQAELLEGRRLEGAERADEVFRLRDAIGEGYGRILARRARSSRSSGCNACMRQVSRE